MPIPRLLTFLALTLAVAATAHAKSGVVATVETAIPADADEGTRLEVRWTLLSKEGHPFNAQRVFIRLIGGDGMSTEAFAESGPQNAQGLHRAFVTTPSGGVATVEIGVAGTATSPSGHAQRSDWIFPLTRVVVP